MASWRQSRTAVLVVASLAVFIDLLLYGVIIPIQPALLEECGINMERLDYYQTLLSGSLAAGLFISTPIFGIVSDRLRTRKAPMLAGLMALAFSTTFFAFTRSFPLLVVARLAQGISAAATWVVGFAMVADAYPSEEGEKNPEGGGGGEGKTMGLGTAIGIVLGAHTVGGFVGPLLGGFLGEHYGLHWPFLLCAALALIDLLGRLVIDPPPPRAPLPTDHSLGMLFLLRQPTVLLTLVTVAFIAASYSSMEVFGASWLIRSWGFSESQTSILMLGFILPNMVAAVLVGWLCDRLPRHRIMAVGLLLHALAAPLVPLANSIVSLIAFSVLFGGTAPIVSAPVSPHLTAIVDRLGGACYARIYAIFNMTWSVGMMGGPWLVGWMKGQWGFFWGMLSVSILCLVWSPVCWFFNGLPPQQICISAIDDNNDGREGSVRRKISEKESPATIGGREDLAMSVVPTN